MTAPTWTPECFCAAGSKERCSVHGVPVDVTAPAWTPEREKAIRERLDGPRFYGKRIMRDDLAAALAEIARFKKLFDDAGQGEHNVLALIDYYQAQELAAWRRSEELEQTLREEASTARAISCGDGDQWGELADRLDAAAAGTARVEQALRDLGSEHRAPDGWEERVLDLDREAPPDEEPNP